MAPDPGENDEPSLQERYAPRSICFGCGPANPHGLRVRSFRSADGLRATWRGRPEHQAFAGVLNGGIVGTLLDCHANWAAAIALMEAAGADAVPATVTADYAVRLLAPTPSDVSVELHARVRAHDGRRARVEAEIHARDATTATFTGTFVAVRAGHPASHRWDR